MLTDARIDEAVVSLKEKLETDSLEGKTFLDVGSGSGPLVWRRETQLRFTLRFDPQSVACTNELRRGLSRR